MEEVRKAVREAYGKIGATDEKSGGCCGPTPSCCGAEGPEATSRTLGYSEEEVRGVPEGANLGLGCGNPQAIAALAPGETVVDLGAGGGFDCFLAAKQVGDSGRVIGVDMTAEMVTRARANAVKAGTTNVEFRLGEIEHLPVADGSVDVIISNCVINLSPDKPAVYRDAFRVLKPGGRLAISDVVATAELPDEAKSDLDSITGCVAGASLISEVEEMLADAGFVDVRVSSKDSSREIIRNWQPGGRLEDYIVSASIEARKP